MVTILLQPSPWLSQLLPFTLNRTWFIKEPIGVTIPLPFPKIKKEKHFLHPPPQFTFVFASHICIFWARLSLRLSRHHFWDSSSGIIVYWCAWEDRECRWVCGTVDIISQVFVQTGLNNACVGNAPAVIFGWSDFFVPFFFSNQSKCCILFLFFCLSFLECCFSENIKTWFAPILPSNCKTGRGCSATLTKFCTVNIRQVEAVEAQLRQWKLSPKCQPNCFLEVVVCDSGSVSHMITMCELNWK